MNHDLHPDPGACVPSLRGAPRENPFGSREETLEVCARLRLSAEQRRKNLRYGHAKTHRGTKNAKSKLTPEDVAEIRNFLRANPSVGLADRTLAASYGVHRKTLYAAAVGEKWQHVETPPVER